MCLVINCLMITLPVSRSYAVTESCQIWTRKLGWRCASHIHLDQLHARVMVSSSFFLKYHIIKKCHSRWANGETAVVELLISAPDAKRVLSSRTPQSAFTKALSKLGNHLHVNPAIVCMPLSVKDQIRPISGKLVGS